MSPSLLTYKFAVEVSKYVYNKELVRVEGMSFVTIVEDQDATRKTAIIL